MDVNDLVTVKQLAASSSVFSEASLRWLIFNAKDNGLDTAIVKPGGRVLIDIRRFNEWLESHRSGSTPPETIVRKQGAS
jgi:hypothetical protein